MAHADAAAEIISTQNFLHRLLAEAYPFYLRHEQGRGYVDFDGNAQSIDFLASTPMRSALADARGSTFLCKGEMTNWTSGSSQSRN
jgi:hypothetical protein